MAPTNSYAIYADLSRALAEPERRAIFEALDANVPGSGYVGSQKGSDGEEEVYFVVEASSEETAGAQAARYMNIILQLASTDVQYTIEISKL